MGTFTCWPGPLPAPDLLTLEEDWEGLGGEGGIKSSCPTCLHHQQWERRRTRLHYVLPGDTAFLLGADLLLFVMI